MGSRVDCTSTALCLLGCSNNPPLPLDSSSEDWLDAVRDSEEGFNEAIRALHELSFERRNQELDSVTIHPVVHGWLSLSDDPDATSQSLSVVAKMIEINLGDYIVGLVTRLIPHADRCIGFSRDQNEWQSWRTSNLYFLATLYCDLSQKHNAWPFIYRLLHRLDREDAAWVPLP